jgi:hypothetical protein
MYEEYYSKIPTKGADSENFKGAGEAYFYN